MNSIENNEVGIGAEKTGAYIPITLQEEFMNGMYSSVDKSTAAGLERLRREEGVTPSCELGCNHCCRHHIVANTVEAHTLAQYVKREFSAEQVNDLETRTRRWHEWDNSRPGRDPSLSPGEPPDLSEYDHCCPLLVDGACSVYPVRPVVCRTHYVSSDPLCCAATNDPVSTEDAPVKLASVVAASRKSSSAIREHIEDSGLDYSRSKMLLPQWLAIKMGWDFALSQ
jgi:Fe-S-cluster containining protein